MEYKIKKSSDKNSKLENLIEDIDVILKKLYVTFLLSIGVKHDEQLTKLIKEAYETII